MSSEEVLAYIGECSLHCLVVKFNAEITCDAEVH